MRPKGRVSSPRAKISFLLGHVYSSPNKESLGTLSLREQAMVPDYCYLSKYSHTVSLLGPQPCQRFGVEWQVGTLPAESDLQPSPYSWALPYPESVLFRSTTSCISLLELSLRPPTRLQTLNREPGIWTMEVSHPTLILMSQTSFSDTNWLPWKQVH